MPKMNVRITAVVLLILVIASAAQGKPKKPKKPKKIPTKKRLEILEQQVAALNQTNNDLVQQVAALNQTNEEQAEAIDAMAKLQAEQHDEVIEAQNKIIDLLNIRAPAACPQPTTSSLGGAACDVTTEGGPWTIVQRRNVGDVLFNESWTTYQAGFGSLSGDYWVGNNALYELCPRPNRTCLVRFEFTWPGETYYTSVPRQPSGHYVAQYGEFSIAGPEDNYRLWINLFDSGNSTASDDMMWSYSLNNRQFSTWDADHDIWFGVNCASKFGGSGGWWYRRCQNANLNGAFGAGDLNGLRWKGVTDGDSATSSRIMVRVVA